MNSFLDIMAVTALLACFCQISLASFRHFGNARRSVRFQILRIAWPVLTLGLFCLWLAQKPQGFGPALLSIMTLSLGSFLIAQAERASGAGVLPTVFTDEEPQHLVQRGIYAHLRNPFYSGYLLYWAAWAILVWAGVFVLVGFAIVYSLAVLGEEKELEARFGSAYLDYRSKTGRFAPRLFRS